MKLWRSVVGKLWATILMLVSFVLIILTMLQLEFFESYHVSQIENNLREQAQKIARIIETHPNDQLGESIVFEVIEESIGVAIAYNQNKISFSPEGSYKGMISIEEIILDPELQEVFTHRTQVIKEISVSDMERRGNRYENLIVVGVPFQLDGQHGGIFVYQSLSVLKDTTQQTTKLIFLAAGIAIILTTFFAFFLSTRITSPLRKMKEAAFLVSKGEFDTKVPFLSNDEIGELAIAFNQMAKRLKINMNVLSQEKEQLKSILRSMADGVITFNKDGSILITNPPADRFLQLWQYESENEGKIPSDLDELLFKAVTTETEQTGEIKIQGRYFVVIVSPLYTQNQESVRGAVAVIRDMTEERRLDKLRNDFLSNVSHELRTPISMLQGYSEAIIDDIVETEEEKKELAKIIYDESLRIGRLVNELLDLARMESGYFSLTYEVVNIRRFLERVLKKFSGIAKEKRIRLEWEIDSKDIFISIDPDRIEQVLTNLIDNALRHNDKEDGYIFVKQTEHADGIKITVEDNGSGIPEEDLPFVFERFYKADKARTRGSSGTGLGLAIAKNIIEAHHGTISVQSKLGIGTTFTIYLPYKK